jgi:PPK2 family polyphosphate:nucleotide phosphotransferase
MKFEDFEDKLIVLPGSKVNLKKDYDPSYCPKDWDKAKADQTLLENTQSLSELQDKLFAQKEYALLIVLQAMDAAGKDSTVKHVMTGINPQGCDVVSFKSPTPTELAHDYLWRCCLVLPPRGSIGIFNRSYYEEVLVARVHPEVLDNEQLPAKIKDKHIWERRFEEINNFEKYLVNNGTLVLKFFLNLSKEEQKARFLKRIDQPEKNWKFSASDVKEREHWDDYMDAYEECLENTSTKEAPWYVIPADYKPFMRLAVGSVICEALKSLKLDYPKVSEEKKQELVRAKEMLEAKK